MHSCETHQTLLLEYVFDLLEDGERVHRARERHGPFVNRFRLSYRREAVR